MILHLYFARRFIMGFILISAVLFSLLVLVDMVIRRAGSAATISAGCASSG